MNTEAAGYGIGSHAYLARAREQLRVGREASLIYAVLELRCGVEARLKELLEPHGHIPKKFKRDYQIKNLSTTVDSYLGSSDVGTLIKFVHVGAAYEWRYVPVSSHLRKLAARAGNYLHALEKAPSVADIETLKREVDEGVRALEECLKGNLLGPPLINQPGTEVRFSVEFINDDDGAAERIQQLFQSGAEVLVQVERFPLIAVTASSLSPVVG